jgi:hypothetical protein
MMMNSKIKNWSDIFTSLEIYRKCDSSYACVFIADNPNTWPLGDTWDRY